MRGYYAKEVEAGRLVCTSCVGDCWNLLRDLVYHDAWTTDNIILAVFLAVVVLLILEV